MPDWLYAGHRWRKEHVLFERVLNWELVALVVYEIDEVDVPVDVDQLAQVLLKRGNLSISTLPDAGAARLTVSGTSMTCKSGLYRRLLTSAQKSGTLPRIWTYDRRSLPSTRPRRTISHWPATGRGGRPALSR